MQYAASEPYRHLIAYESIGIYGIQPIYFSIIIFKIIIYYVNYHNGKLFPCATSLVRSTLESFPLSLYCYLHHPSAHHPQFPLPHPQLPPPTVCTPPCISTTLRPPQMYPPRTHPLHLPMLSTSSPVTFSPAPSHPPPHARTFSVSYLQPSM